MKAARLRRAASPLAAPLQGRETIEADYVVLGSACARPKRAAPALAGAPLQGMDLLGTGRSAPARPFARRGGAGFWCLGLALAALSFWTAGGHALVFGPSAGLNARASGPGAQGASTATFRPTETGGARTARGRTGPPSDGAKAADAFRP
jgi:hypothetical protein